jgi:hypothetical protein
MHMKFWVNEPALVKLLVLAVFGIFLNAIVQLSRVAFSLYRPAKSEPDNLASYALATRIPPKTGPISDSHHHA